MQQILLGTESTKPMKFTAPSGDRANSPYYKVEVSAQPNPRSKYLTRYGTANAVQAELLYEGINVGYGYRKRLVKFEGSARKIVARCVSY